ncbi:MAG: AAA family ATPase [Proteobacteria bacterium]|nr:AAA family ATPase [Pseudomonadota bacterium]
MTELIDLKSCSIQDFYKTLRSLNGIEPIDAKIHKLLCDMQPDMSLDAQKALYIFFSLMDDGNTRMPLDANEAQAKWHLKFHSMIRLMQSELAELPINPETAKSDFDDMIAKGIKDLAHCDKIIEYRASGLDALHNDICKPLVSATDPKTNTDYLYATRFFDAKCIIEHRAKDIFPKKARKITKRDMNAVQKSFLSDLKEPFTLAERQLEAIIRGQDENLIITGGPGTGKTTTICFLLWKLLKDHPEMRSWEINLAAPSGKAADRMRESLLSSLDKFKDSSSEIYRKLHDLESYTLHRLLSYSPIKKQFTYNEQNRFPQNYIFIIDEASMIDLDLFARFMAALPEENFRLFILGDPDQLPSVQAGAVLGEMLNTSSFATQLNESKRFDNTSEIGKLSIAIQLAKDPNTAMKDNWPEGYIKPFFSPFEAIAFDPQSQDAIHTLSLSDSPKNAEKELAALIKNWTDAFYIKPDFIDLANHIRVRTSNGTSELVDENDQPVSRQTLDTLWKVTESARILSANRNGLTGVETLNALVRKSLKIQTSDPFFVGQILMLNENQSMLKLYNGDCGIVLGEPGTGRLHLMLKKARTQTVNHTDTTAIDYVTYPLYMLPAKSLESAFAITIHKSQGSGYKHIMMFLPTMEGHPLLNNQMIYTGVTRTERQSLTIVTTQSAFEAGCKTIIKRDTGIDLSDA